MSEHKGAILVTGSSGRLGYPLAKRLAESYNVVGFDRRAPPHPPPSAECLYVDLTSDEQAMQELTEVIGRFATPTIVIGNEVLLGFGANRAHIEELLP